MNNTNTNAGKYYTIRLREKLDDRWGDWFDTITIATDGAGTTLAGHLPGQAALHGIIARIQRPGRQLVAINQHDGKEHT